MYKLRKAVTYQIHSDFRFNGKSFTSEEFQEEAIQLVRTGEVYEQEIGVFLKEWFNDKSYITSYTSGSTGDPKPIRLPKERMINSARATGDFFKVKENTTALLCLPARYIAGKMMLVRAMVLGWRLDTVPYRSNPLDHVYRQYDFCAMVPLQLDNSLNRLHLLKKLIVGGGAVSEHLSRLVQGVSAKIFETYGMTETISHIAVKRLNPKKKKNIAKPVFKALPSVTFQTDERNCLIIKAPNIIDEPLITNDVVELHTYKQFTWKGRYDNVINSSGIKLYPEEIEKKLEVLISQRFFVASEPDDVLGDKLILVVEQPFEENIYAILEEEIVKLGTLFRYEIPREIYFLPKFMETPTGKIQRNETLNLLYQQNSKSGAS